MLDQEQKCGSRGVSYDHQNSYILLALSYFEMLMGILLSNVNCMT